MTHNHSHSGSQPVESGSVALGGFEFLPGLQSIHINLRSGCASSIQRFQPNMNRYGRLQITFMPRHAPELECSTEDRASLTALARSGKAEARVVDRARFILSCLEGKEIQWRGN